MAKQQQKDEVLSISDRNVVGMLQRELFEMDAYLRQPAHQVDKNTLRFGLQEIAKFIEMLPEPMPVENGRSARN